MPRPGRARVLLRSVETSFDGWRGHLIKYVPTENLDQFGQHLKAGVAMLVTVVDSASHSPLPP